MRITLHQPNYLPWIGFFHKLSLCDGIVLLDHVQYEKNGPGNRNEIKGPNGAVRLTVPVRGKGRFGQTVAEVEIDQTSGWSARHWKSLSQAYARSDHFAEHAPFFEALYARSWVKLALLNEEIIQYLAGAFGLKPRTWRSSELAASGAKTEMLVGLCRAVGATECLTGTGSREYLDPAVFTASGIGHRFHRFRHPIYPQSHGAFVSHLSAVDLLFHAGPAAADVLRQCEEEENGGGGADGGESGSGRQDSGAEVRAEVSEGREPTPRLETTAGKEETRCK